MFYNVLALCSTWWSLYISSGDERSSNIAVIRSHDCACALLWIMITERSRNLFSVFPGVSDASCGTCKQYLWWPVMFHSPPNVSISHKAEGFICSVPSPWWIMMPLPHSRLPNCFIPLFIMSHTKEQCRKDFPGLREWGLGDLWVLMVSIYSRTFSSEAAPHLFSVCLQAWLHHGNDYQNSVNIVTALFFKSSNNCIISHIKEVLCM